MNEFIEEFVGKSLCVLEKRLLSLSTQEYVT